MKCLNCGEEMVNYLAKTEDDQLSYDICESCASLWLDKNELDKMAFQVDGSIEFSSEKESPEIQEKTKMCPRCENHKLSKVFFIGYSDIVLDHCENCGGFWLDGGELDLINKELEKIMPVTGKGFSDFVNNTHLPYWHKRIKRKSSDVDFEVSVPPLKGAEEIEQSEFDCPVCEPPVKMDLYWLNGVEFEACPDCRGVYLDKDELRKLKDRAENETWLKLNWIDDEIDEMKTALASDSNRFCPKCPGTKMVVGYYGKSDIVIDWCPKCGGTWLDGGEFRQIVDYLKAQLLNYSSEEIKEKLKQELKEVSNGPETKWEELKDAKAALSAFLAVSTYENPRLFKMLQSISRTAHTMGLY
ncbi:MAG: zf-TFIIB domain-containing protein [Candidatus Eremiobacteraeota bacterium]|nr:zf-TFIIB domain-containing protein [Candidatus Eremiobacteraeota bacterium]